MNAPACIPADYRPPRDLLAGRVILVTGAGSGIGLAVSRAFAAHGASVVLLGNRVRPLERAYDQIIAAGGPQPAIYPLDLAGATDEDYRVLAETVVRELGPMSGLLHNAAHFGGLAPIEQHDVTDWIKSMQVNVNAAFMLTRACLPGLRASGDGRVLFTSAAVGRRGRAYWGAYAAAKFALQGLMQVLADELDAEGIVRVNSIDPGEVRTELRRTAYSGDPTPAGVPLPEAVVAPYLYLMGPTSRHLHGHGFLTPGLR